MPDLTTIFHHLQRQLFSALNAELGLLSALDQQFCEVISLTDMGRFTRSYEWRGNGAPPCHRLWLAHAFIARSVYQLPLTRALIDALQSRPLLRSLCGWDSAGEVPSEATFSRALTQFACPSNSTNTSQGGQGDVPSDVRAGGADGHGALCAAVLKPARPTAGGWRR